MNISKEKRLTLLKEFLIITFADGIVGFATYFFLIPSSTVISSVSGIAIVLVNIIPLPISVITFLLNSFLLLLGFLLCGSDFGSKTVYGALLLSGYLAIFEHIFPDQGSLTGSQEIDVVAYIVLIGFSSGILFHINASSGGLDIVGKIISKFCHIDIGRAIAISGMCVALTSAIFFDKKTVVLSILGTYFDGMIIDHFLFSQNIKRRVCIISDKLEEIRQFVIEDLHSGASVYEFTGALRMEKHIELVTIVDKSEYQKLMAYMRKTDPHAFMTVYNVNDIQYTKKPKSGIKVEGKIEWPQKKD